MPRSRPWFVWSLSIPAALTLVTALAGCSNAGYLTLQPDETTLSPCPKPTTIPVQRLRSSAEPSCTPSGSELVFPSGVRVTIDEQAGAGSHESTDDPVRYSWIDVGNYGIVAGQATKSCARHHVWGTPDAVRKVRGAFGATWPCN